MDNLLQEILNWEYGYEDENKLNAFLENAKSYYQKEVANAHLDDDDLIYFSWAKQPLHIYLIRTSGLLGYKQILVMASQEDDLLKNEITYIDKTEETNNAQFKHSHEEEQVNYILSRSDMPKGLKSDNIIKNSIFTLSISSVTEIWISLWFGKEINHTKQHFSTAPINLKFPKCQFKLEKG